MPQRLRAAVEALPFERPKLAATAVIYEGDLASRLERAIERSAIARSGKQLPPLIEINPLLESNS